MEDPKHMYESHPEIDDIKGGLGEAYKGCATGRERIGVDARAIRTATEAWLKEVNRVTREAQAMLHALESWSNGHELPAFARDLVDAISGRGGRDTIPHDVSSGLIWWLALEAATYERPDLQHSMELEELPPRPTLIDWKAQVARELAKRSESGFDPDIHPCELTSPQRMLEAFMEALRGADSATELEAAE